MIQGRVKNNQYHTHKNSYLKNLTQSPRDCANVKIMGLEISNYQLTIWKNNT